MARSCNIMQANQRWQYTSCNRPKSRGALMNHDPTSFERQKTYAGRVSLPPSTVDRSARPATLRPVQTRDASNGARAQGRGHFARQLQVLREQNGVVRVVLPLEVVHQARQPQLRRGEAERAPGAHPPPGPERRQPQIRPQNVQLLHAEESARVEEVRLWPDPGVVCDRPHVDHGGGVLGNVVAGDLRVVRGDARPREERPRRVRAERLLEHGLQVGQAVDVAGVDAARAAHHVVQLVVEALLNLRVEDDLCERPFCQHRDRVGASKHHLLTLHCPQK